MIITIYENGQTYAIDQDEIYEPFPEKEPAEDEDDLQLHMVLEDTPA